MASVYSPEGVRPLNVTNTDNRLVASSVRAAIEPTLGQLVTMDQRGFISGRSMLANILDVEEAMAMATFRGIRSLAVLFDFSAAFPSIEHALMFEYFDALEWPQWLMRIIRILYQGNSCDISMGPVAFFGFSITRGIRQGCPLSPLLFAVASELILRRLSRSVRDNTARAWADDIAMVIPRGLEVLPCIASIFLEFGLISGLLLSIGKTVIAPLFPIDLVEFRSLLTAAVPSWGAMQVSFAAKYLGVFVGPDKGTRSWTAPIRKYLDRAQQWGRLGLGLHMSIRAYSTYILSVLMFVGQLEPLPHSFDGFEATACRRLFPGPYRWIVPEVLKQLKAMHFPVELRDATAFSVAARSRVLRTENLQQGGLRVRQRRRAIQRAMNQCADENYVWAVQWIPNLSFAHLVSADDLVQSRLDETRSAEQSVPILQQWLDGQTGRRETTTPTNRLALNAGVARPGRKWR